MIPKLSQSFGIFRKDSEALILRENGYYWATDLHPRPAAISLYSACARTQFVSWAGIIHCWISKSGVGACIQTNVGSKQHSTNKYS